jgi:hypothetical protein
VTVKSYVKYRNPILGALFPALLACAALSQAPEPAPKQAYKQAQQQALREIFDPHSGALWLLVKDAEHPGGPGRLILRSPEEVAAIAPKATRQKASALVIRAGDRVVVEEHSGVADAVLEAVALAPAAEQEPLRVRLRIGGRVLRAVAVAPGRARLTPAGEARP